MLADGDVFVGGEGTEDGELQRTGLAVDFGLNDARLLLWRDDLSAAKAKKAAAVAAADRKPGA